MSFKKVNPNIINNTNRDREKFNSYRTEINSPFRNELNNNFIEPNSNQSANNITERNLFNNNKNNLFNYLMVNKNNNYLLNKRKFQTNYIITSTIIDLILIGTLPPLTRGKTSIPTPIFYKIKNIFKLIIIIPIFQIVDYQIIIIIHFQMKI